MTPNIQLEWTPNPSTLKYVVDRTLLPKGAVNFPSKDAVGERSPLAAKLFGIEGVQGVMIGGNFVTVTKGEEGEWDVLNDSVMAILDAHLSADEPVVLGEISSGHTVGADGTVEQQIRSILDSEIRPAVMQDGGDITLDRYEDGVAYVHMRGSCSGCPSSTATLRMGIESRLREVVPDLVEVVPV
jgi:Fe-S cluster biogenesis protein NfuA